MAKFSNFNIDSLKRYERGVVKTVVIVMAVSGLLAVLLGGPQFLEHLKAVPPHAVVLLIVMSAIENAMRIYRYRIFSNALKLPVPWHRLMLYYIAGMALLPTPGKIGVALRLWLLRQHHGILYRRSAPLLAMDVLTDTLAMMILIAIGVMAMGGNIHGATLGLFILASIIGGVMFILLAPGYADNMVKLLYRLSGKRAPRTFATIKALLRLMHNMMSIKVLVLCTTISLVAWALFGFSLSYLMLSMGYPVSWHLGAFGLCSGTILGFVTMAPAGVGGAEASMTAIYHAAGVPLSVAFIIAMLGRMAALWIPVLIGFIALPIALRIPMPAKKK